MARKKKNRDPVTPLQSMEEATTLLRHLSPSTWLLWFVGTIPWVIAFIHFWNDMSRAADAPGMLIERSLYVAVTYVLMKTTHALFADRLLATLRGQGDWEALSLRGWLRLVSSQAMIHSTMPWVLAIAGLAVLPIGWAYAFYQNVSVLALSTFRSQGRMRDLVRAALRQSHYRAGHNHWMILLALPFSLLVWANILIGIVTAVSLTKSFTGVHSEFTRNPYTYADTGFIAATVALAFLFTGPLLKAIYALRCFQGQSRKNGEDIEVSFRLSAGLKKWPTAAAVAALMAASAPAQQASDPTPLPVDAAPLELRESIDEVLQKDIYQWRLPRGAESTADESWIGMWLTEAVRWVGETLQSIMDWLIEDLIRDLFEGGPNRDYDSGSSTPWADISLGVLKVLLVVVVLVLVVLLIKQWRGLKIAPRATAAATPAPVNLESDSVVASELPEDEWLRLADEKIAEGDYRLAMRALFLASLAFLGEQRLVAISRSKSNGDYVLDLKRRARDKTGLQDTFQQQVRRFDWAWYGWHDVTPEWLKEFRGQHERITRHES
jgi:hypothetical protein